MAYFKERVAVIEHECKRSCELTYTKLKRGGLNNIIVWLKINNKENRELWKKIEKDEDKQGDCINFVSPKYIQHADSHTKYHNYVIKIKLI